MDGQSFGSQASPPGATWLCFRLMLGVVVLEEDPFSPNFLGTTGEIKDVFFKPRLNDGLVEFGI